LIFENRSGAYIVVCEQRIAENQRFSTELVEFLTGSMWHNSDFSIIVCQGGNYV